MSQKSLNGQGILAVESKIAKTIGYGDVIEDFARQTAQIGYF